MPEVAWIFLGVGFSFGLALGFQVREWLLRAERRAIRKLLRPWGEFIRSADHMHEELDRAMAEVRQREERAG